MLKPDYLFGVSDSAVELFEQLNTFAINDICQRLIKADYQKSGTAEWQYFIMQQVGMNREEINKQIAQTLHKSQKEIRDIFEESSYRSYSADKAIFDKAGLDVSSYTQSESITRILDANYKATMGELSNLTQTTASSSQQLLINTLNEMMIRVQTGAQSKGQAIKDAVSKVAQDGLNVEYDTGAKRSIESVVRMCVTTGVNKASGEITLQACKEYGTDLILTSSHLGARIGEGYKGHINWQGMIFSISGESDRYPSFVEKCGYGKMLGIFGINCRHSAFPYIEGISHNPFERYDSPEEQKIYADQQKQRLMERRVRNTKRQLRVIEKSIGMTAETDIKDIFQKEYDRVAYKLRSQNAKYNDFSKENNLVKQSDRLQTDRFNRSEAQKAIQGAKRYEKIVNA